MTEKQNLCENCGHEKRFHEMTKEKICSVIEGDFLPCSCKKFTPKKGLDKKSKGCGDDFIDDEENERMCGKSNNYGQMFYCDKCKAKNPNGQEKKQ